jgi:DNA-binding MarR family transcriptional regulator
MSTPTVRVTAERLDAWRAFLRAHAAVVGALEAELEGERDLPLPWYDVLVSLSDAGGRLRMQDLADRVLFSRSGLTRLVDRMATAGLVARERCEDDRRGTYAVLTGAGAARLREAAGVHLRGIHDHFTSHLADADVVALTEALDKVLRAETGRGLEPVGRVWEGARAPIPSS